MGRQREKGRSTSEGLLSAPWASLADSQNKQGWHRASGIRSPKASSLAVNSVLPPEQVQFILWSVWKRAELFW